MMRLIFPALLITLLLSCGIQKRKYQKGYYVDLHRTSPQRIGNNHCENPRQKQAHRGLEVAPVPAPADMNLASSENKPGIIFASKPVRLLRTEPDTCDILTYKSGEEIRVKILEITPVEIKYHKCGMAGGPLYVSRKAEVFMVKYANGTKEVFKTETTAPTVINNESRETSIQHPEAEIVLVLGICGLTVGYGGIHAIILGNRVLREIRARPDKYKGEDVVKIGITLGWVKVGIMLLFIVFMLALFSSFI